MSEVETVSEQRRFGVIGTGVWGETHLMAYASHPGVELACICDLDEELLAQRAEQYGVECTTTDYREIAVAAAEAGKHVLLEKPMATTVEDCETMIAAAEASGVTLMVDFHNRWNPAMWGIKQQIVAGDLGAPQMLTVRLNDTIYVPTGMLSWGGRSTVIWFLGSHSVDLVRWLFDDEITRVYSVARSHVLKARGVDTPDFFLTTVELAGGGVAQIENCWIMSTAMPTVFDFKLEMIGSEGTCFADCSSHRMLQSFTPAGASYADVAVRTEVQGEPGGFGVNSIRHFADCVIEGREPAVSPRDGLENTRVLVAIHESAESGQPVELPR